MSVPLDCEAPEVMERHVSSPEPLVSFGVPTRNRARLLRGALDALLAQDYGNFEIVVCDNCSTDETDAVIDEYARRDKRVRHHRQPQPVSLWENWITSLQLARGAYFIWAADDDRWRPNFTSELVRTMLRDNLVSAFSMCTEQYVTSAGEVLSQVPHRIDYPNVRTRHSVLRNFLSWHFSPYTFMVYGVHEMKFLRDLDFVRDWERFVDFQPLENYLISQLLLSGRVELVGAPLYARGMIADGNYPQYGGNVANQPHQVYRYASTISGRLARERALAIWERVICILVVWLIQLHDDWLARTPPSVRPITSLAARAYMRLLRTPMRWLGWIVPAVAG